MEQQELTSIIINCAYIVHNKLGAGFLEKVYERAMEIELTRAGLNVKRQYPVAVYYDEYPVGEYFADLFVNDTVIVELKAVEYLVPAFETKLVNYLAGTKVDIGLLINFGSSVEVKRKYRVYKKT